MARLSEAGDALLPPAAETIYASTGHSFGAITALTVGGGELDYQGVVDYCAGGGGGTPCEYLDDIDPAEVADHGAADERAVVTVPMSPGVWYAFEGEGLDAVRRPTVLGGDLDEVTEYEEEIRPTYEHLDSPKVLFTFFDAGHYAFSDICRLAPFLSEECGGVEDGYIDLERAQQITNTLVTATLGRDLVGDERYEALAERRLPGRDPRDHGRAGVALARAPRGYSPP